MRIKPGIVGYLPPPTFGCADAFYDNLHKYKTNHQRVLYSDHPYGDGVIRISNPEKALGVENNPRWGINNACFISGVRLAAKAGLSHMLYIESDCRFGTDMWDRIVFDEYFSLSFPVICAGSLVSHSCVNGGPVFYDRFVDLISENRRSSLFRIPIYGVPLPEAKQGQFPPLSPNIVLPGDPRDNYKPCVYPNGALGVYDVRWLCEIFGITKDGNFKEGNCQVDQVLKWAWDHVIGMWLYDHFGANIFDVVAHLETVFSSYGNRLTCEADRIQLLMDKKCVAIHQVKSNYVC